MERGDIMDKKEKELEELVQIISSSLGDVTDWAKTIQDRGYTKKHFPVEELKEELKINRIWAMPNKWTFIIKPIRELIKEEMSGETWIDPFAGMNSPAQMRNDLNPDMDAPYHLEALAFLKMWGDNSMDGAFFDPPYSPRQVKECYEGIGMKTAKGNTKMTFWSQCKDEIARILKPGGKAICCGWSSMGLGKGRGFKMERILLVPHGGNKNDTIVTVEHKIKELEDET